MKIEIKTHKQSYGTNGWIEGYDKVKIKMCVLMSKSTGLTIRLPVDIVKEAGKITPKIIRQTIQSRYPKQYRRVLNGNDQWLTDDFDLNNEQNKI